MLSKSFTIKLYPQLPIYSYISTVKFYTVMKKNCSKGLPQGGCIPQIQCRVKGIRQNRTHILFDSIYMKFKDRPQNCLMIL